MTFQYTHTENPESSAIDTVWYNAKTMQLVVEFASSGTLAGYAGVSDAEYGNLVNSESVGSYFAHYIKGRYPGFSVDQRGYFEYLDLTPVESVSELGKFTLTASVSSDVSMTVEGTDLEAALASFRARIEEAMKGNPVTITFKSAVPA
jgi:hypothetical protein